jgi:hypothetical protein
MRLGLVIKLRRRPVNPATGTGSSQSRRLMPASRPSTCLRAKSELETALSKPDSAQEVGSDEPSEASWRTGAADIEPRSSVSRPSKNPYQARRVRVTHLASSRRGYRHACLVGPAILGRPFGQTASIWADCVQNCGRGKYRPRKRPIVQLELKDSKCRVRLESRGRRDERMGTKEQ